MARRLFNGNKFSENGWPYVDEGSCRWGKVPGTNGRVSLQVQDGLPFRLIMAWAADWNEFVEPLRDRDSACWTLGNSVRTSNHPGGTACDLNWDDHPFEVWARPGVGGCGFTAQQIATLEEMVEFYENNMFWANNWNYPKDAMHTQLGYGTYISKEDRVNPALEDFVNRKIRADGFSTFRRGGIAAPAPAPEVDLAKILADATGIAYDHAVEVLPQVQEGLKDSECNTVNRVAFWLAQIGHESDDFNATEEYQDGDESTDRWRYKGRTWIQITWASNYAGFSRWCYDRDLVDTSNYFVVNPRQLAEQKWAGLGPAWYWTVERDDINALCDAGDFVSVTHRINGGENGLYTPNGRLARLRRAQALGDKLLLLIGEGGLDIMAAVSREEWDALVSKVNAVTDQLTDPIPSLSGYRDEGEPDIPNFRQVARNVDLMRHHRYVEESAIELGDFDSIRRIIRSSRGEGVDKSPEFVRRAQNALHRLEVENDGAALKAYLASKGVAI